MARQRKTEKARWYIDKVEYTYTTSQEMRSFLQNIPIDGYVDLDTLDGEGRMTGTRLRRKTPNLYEYEFDMLICDSGYQGKNCEAGRYNHHVGSLYFGCPRPNRSDIYFMQTNESLYLPYMRDLRMYIEPLLHLTFKRVSKLELGVDTNFDIMKCVMRIYRNAADYDLIVNGRLVSEKERIQEVVVISGDNPRHTPYANKSLTFRNRHGNLKARLYNKKLEIEMSGKYYISDSLPFHQRDAHQRIEIAASNYKLIRPTLQYLNLSDEDLYVGLFDEQTIKAIFYHLLDRLVRVRKRGSRAGHSLLLTAIDEYERMKRMQDEKRADKRNIK